MWFLSDMLCQHLDEDQTPKNRKRKFFRDRCYFSSKIELTHNKGALELRTIAIKNKK